MPIVIKPIVTDAEKDGRAWVHYKAWQEAYTGLIRPEVLDSRTLEQAVERSRASADRSLAALDAVLVSCAEASDSDEAYLEAVRGSLPAGMRLEERTVTWNESDELRTLECAVELLPMGGAERYSWRVHRLSAVTEEIWN